MQAFFNIMGISPRRWEIEALVQLDVAFMNSRAEKEKAKSAKEMMLNMNQDQNG